MGNILDYLKEATDSFGERPFCEVDSLVLCELAYVYFDGFVPEPGGGSVSMKDLTDDETVSAMTKAVRVPEQDSQLIRAIAQSPRFADLRLANYVNVLDKEAQQQFSAVTFLLGDDGYVAYRGTDAYYVAWKEDFNLAFICPVPSQVSGADYLSRVGAAIKGKLRVGGHSKGGNIAVYSAAFCDPAVRALVASVYSHDGPGFESGVLESPEFGEVKSRVYKTIPQSSLVGMLLQHQEEHQVIRSNSYGILQHDPYTWVVENKDFCYLESLSSSAIFLNNSLNEWIASLSPEQLSQFADALYKVLCTLGGDTFTDLPAEWWKVLPAALEGLKDLDADTRDCIYHTVGSLVTLIVKNLSWPDFHITLPEIKLPDIPLPKISLPKAPSPESLLNRLPFWK